MTHFIQLHVLTFYPPSNLNRDDLGRPKTAEVGGTTRIRISSQCLKRTWRTSPVFREQLGGSLGVRTKRVGKEYIYPVFEKAGIKEKDALAWCESMVGVFGKTENKLETKQLVHYSQSELEAIEALAQKLASEKRAPGKEELQLLKMDHGAADIALFGRMLAEAPGFNTEAAAQVSHAFSVNRIELEDDFFTAVDDLNRAEDSGAGHLDENWFSSGVFYLYICINRDLLLENLGGDEDLAQRALKALTEAVVRVSPGGKQNSYAALSPAAFVRAEKGETQPRSLALAFMKPTNREQMLEDAVENLTRVRENLDNSYETAPEAAVEFYPAKGEGKLSGLLDFVGAS